MEGVDALPRLFRNKPFIIALVAVVLLIVMIVVTSGNNNLTMPENAVGTVLTPAEGFLDNITGGLGDFLGSIFMPAEKRVQMTDLQKRIAELENENQTLMEQKAENERLKELLDFQDKNSEFSFVAAKVIAKTPGYWFDTFTINIGKNKGVDVDMAVVNSKGLVGRVIEAGADYSIIMSIIDGQSNVSIMVERTRDNGMLHGAMKYGEQNRFCTLHYLPYEADIVPGDRIITSGLGGVFPKGLYIGDVVEASQVQTEDKEVYIKPAVDFLHVEEVMVVVSGTPQPGVSEEAVQ